MGIEGFQQKEPKKSQVLLKLAHFLIPDMRFCSDFGFLDISCCLFPYSFPHVFLTLLCFFSLYFPGSLGFVCLFSLYFAGSLGFFLPLFPLFPAPPLTPTERTIKKRARRPRLRMVFLGSLLKRRKEKQTTRIPPISIFLPKNQQCAN